MGDVVIACVNCSGEVVIFAMPRGDLARLAMVAYDVGESKAMPVRRSRNPVIDRGQCRDAWRDNGPEHASNKPPGPRKISVS